MKYGISFCSVSAVYQLAQTHCICYIDNIAASCFSFICVQNFLADNYGVLIIVAYLIMEEHEFPVGLNFFCVHMWIMCCIGKFYLSFSGSEPLLFS
jgi:hypothetical protein